MTRVAIAVSHPIQHFCPLYAFLAEDPRFELRVFFGVEGGARGYYDPGFGREVSFAGSLALERFDHRFLSSSSDPRDELALGRRSVWKALSAFGPDVVLVYGLRRPTAGAGWAWAKAHRRRVAYISDSEDRGGERSRRRLLLSRALAPPLLRTVDTIFTVGDANERYYSKRLVPSSRLVRAPFPIDRERYDRAAADGVSRSERRARLGLPEGPLVLNVGKFTPLKRQADVVRAAALMPGAVAVCLVGSGEDLETVRALAADLGVECITPGFVPPADLPDWYLAADVYVQPSTRDRHSLSVSEAVYSGLPVVVSDRTGSHGPTDDVRPWVNGLVYPMGDVQALARQLALAGLDRSRRDAFAEASGRIGRTQQDLAYHGLADALVRLADVAESSP